MHSTTLYTSFKNTGQSFKKLVSMPTTQRRSHYPISIPWRITGFTLRNLAPQLAYVHLLLSQNTSPPSNDPGADQINVKRSSRSSSPTRGTISLQALTWTSSSVECWKVPLSQTPSEGYFHPTVIISYHRTRCLSSQRHNCLRAQRMMRKTCGDWTMRVSQARLSSGRCVVCNTTPGSCWF